MIAIAQFCITTDTWIQCNPCHKYWISVIVNTIWISIFFRRENNLQVEKKSVHHVGNRTFHQTSNKICSSHFSFINSNFTAKSIKITRAVFGRVWTSDIYIIEHNLNIHNGFSIYLNEIFILIAYKNIIKTFPTAIEMRHSTHSITKPNECNLSKPCNSHLLRIRNGHFVKMNWHSI